MQMLKLLIVDDEPIIRSGIRGIIEWDKFDYEICGEAEDGPSAVDAINKLKPDLVLLDLHLPGFSGLEVIKKTLKVKPRFLILSGHTEFEYAKEAIDLGVEGYIVKPIDENILTDKIIAIAKKIKRKEPEEVKKIQFMEIMEGTYRKDEHEDFYFKTGSVQAAFIHVGDTARQETALPTVTQILKDFFQNKYSVFSYNETPVIIFENTVETVVKHLLENLYDYMEKTGNCHPQSGSRAITLGPCCEEDGSGEGIRKTCRGAEKLADSIFFYRGKKFICTEDTLNKDNSAACRDMEEEAKKLCSYIQVIDNNKINLFFKDLENYFFNSGKSHQEIRQECMALMIEVRSTMLKKVPALKENTDYNAAGSGKEILDIIMKQRYLGVIIGAMSEVCAHISRCLPLLSADASLQRVISYVKNNYNEDLKLETLAELFNYNCAYLGKRFKEYTGKSFHTYLDMLRIDAAKEMLKNTDMKVYEISSAVGYANTDYFYSKFKKYAKESPLIYRKKTVFFRGK
jgi:two-component system response regulator YesN